MKYYSEVLDEMFDSVLELNNAEKLHQIKTEAAARKAKEEEEKKAKIKAEQAAAKKEIEDSINHSTELLMNYVKKYGYFDWSSLFKSPSTETVSESFVDLLERFLN